LPNRNTQKKVGSNVCVVMVDMPGFGKPAGDTYAFGVILWELLTRRHPYEEFTFMAQLEDAITAGGCVVVSMWCG